MRIDEVGGEFSKVKVVMYNAQGDKAVFHWKNIRQMEGSIWVGEGKPDGYGNAYYRVFAKWPDVDVGLYVDQTNGWRTSSELTEWLEHEGYQTKESFVAKMKERIENKLWIKLTEVEMIKIVVPELESDALRVRDEIAEIRAKKRAQREKEIREEDEKFVKESNEMSEAILKEAIEKIKAGGVIENKEIAFWKDRYECKKVHVITELMDRYNVKVPIRTRGWIMNLLNSMTVKDGGVVGCNWMRCGRAKISDRFWDVAEELVKKVVADGKV